MTIEDHAFFDTLLDIGLAADTGLDALDTAELAELWRRCEQYQSLLAAARKKIGDSLVLIMDRPIVLDDVVLKRRSVCKRSGWDKPRLVDALTEWARRRLIDQETGEVVDALDPRKVTAAFEPATGRTKFLIETVGLRLGEFCTEEWVDELEKVKL